MDDSTATAISNPSPDTAVLLLQLGGPGSVHQVRTFIRRMLSDPAVVALPWPVRLPLAALVAFGRAPVVKRQYKVIGGGSPIRRITEAQAARLQEALLRLGHGMPVLLGMRHSEPSFLTALAQVKAMGGVKTLVLLPLFPHFSRTTTGSLLDAVRGEANGVLDLTLVPILDWAEETGYVKAVVRTIEDALSRLSEGGRRDPVVLFSAHGLPESHVRRGDPYPKRVMATIKAVEVLMGSTLPRHAVCYQSRLGPLRWLGPSTKEAILSAAQSGASAVILVPISFVCDHLETLYEMDVVLRAVATRAGLECVRAPCMNDSLDLAQALATMVVKTLRRHGSGPAGLAPL